MTKEEKSNALSVDIRHIEQAYDVDLHEFKPEVTYPLAKLMDGFMKPGRSKITRGRDKN